MNRQLRNLRGRPAALAMFCLGVAAVWLVLISLVAMIAMSPATDSLATAAKRLDTVLGKPTQGDAAAPTTSTTTAPAATAPIAGATHTAVAGGSDTSGITGVAALPPSSAPGDTTGVTDTEIHIGIHAPE